MRIKGPQKNVSRREETKAVKSKVTTILEHADDSATDSLLLTETWLQSTNTVKVNELQATGKVFKGIGRIDRMGSGVGGLLSPDIMCDAKANTTNFSTFEHVELVLKTPLRMKVFVVYRPPVKSVVTPFLEEFADFLDSFVSYPGKLLIGGDFNFHMDNLEDSSTIRFNDLLRSFDLVQRVTGPTHKKGHTLDLLITRSADSFVSNVEVVNHLISDHYSINLDVRLDKPETGRKAEHTTRDYRSMDRTTFFTQLDEKLQSVDTASDTDSMFCQYNGAVRTLLNEHALIISRQRKPRTRAPWYTAEVHQLRRERRRTERAWRKSGLVVHKEIFIQARDCVNRCVEKAKATYYKDRLQSGDKNVIFRVLKHLLNTSGCSLPDHDSEKQICNDFVNFFTYTILSKT
ncbi:uncharacterized protein LOC135501716 [Lineus longissimus]|uniref:uncharacterized protein LOC135501716 n=1 Tax=Lineus longissimus TaxID=88925 RepID=UPI00315C9087